MKDEQVKIVSLPKPFDIFNIDRNRSKNHRITWFALLELQINGYIENIDAVIIA